MKTLKEVEKEINATRVAIAELRSHGLSERSATSKLATISKAKNYLEFNPPPNLCRKTK